MTEIVGGKEICAHCYIPCIGDYDKNTCYKYKDCENHGERLICKVYQFFEIGFEYTYDIAEEFWYVEAR
jgi:hypothetical protein